VLSPWSYVVNDLGSNIIITVLIVPDDGNLFEVDKNSADGLELQNDLDMLVYSAEKRQMSVNVDKC
jgi:hypothetical protein